MFYLRWMEPLWLYQGKSPYFRQEIKGNNSERCEPCRNLHSKKLMRDYARDLRLGIRRRCPDKKSVQAADYSRNNLKTEMQPDPVIMDPYASPCRQGCTVFRALNTYDNTTCMACSYRVRYVAMIEPRTTAEYMTEGECAAAPCRTNFQ